ncbi:hypothetical protein [Methylobacterium sp. J-092]|uniref:hypothetical protein n=1 Tax=Methylobacterium sp. J-092 TaxID=2836667 RepID=UPI001FB8B879|nr:hypothetical protein [Methylobacterium sp. J-092]MCJ2006265.1 hypothetical protein [Methylobacterium sp. J-092]
MDVRVSLVDFRIACRAVEEAHRAGRGALERSAVAFGVRRAVVKAAIDRVEAALGGIPFFEVQVRRSGLLTPVGDTFRQKGPKLIQTWELMLPLEVVPAQTRPPVSHERKRKTASSARPVTTMAELVAMVGRQDQTLREMVALVEASQTDARGDGTAPAGTKAADAMLVVLTTLRKAGGVGVATADLRDAQQAAGFRSSTAETARAVLRNAGLVRCEGRRWYVAEP